MRIEHQGYIQVQPAYQHVGYISAALSNAYASVGSTGVLTASVLFTVALLVALGSRRRAGYVAAGLIVLLGMGAYATWGAAQIRRAARVQEQTDVHMVVTELRSACAGVDKWAETQKRLPTEEEWTTDVHLGGPGRRLYDYHRLAKPGPDGRRYVIVSRPGPKAAVPAETISSEWLGEDGQARTPDDDPKLSAILQRYGMAR